jgi:hypothetical protein
MRRCILLPLLLSVLLPAATIAGAGVPSPANSSVDPCLVLCPAGDIPFNVVVHDLSNNPVQSSFVVLDFSACPAFVHCASMPPSLIVNDAAHTIGGFTDTHGLMTFAIPMGGTCAGNAVRVIADAVVLATRSLASPDRDGSLFVTGADQAAVQALVGSGDPTADFNCDGAVTIADVVFVGQHIGHTCEGATPSRSRSWGALKLIYR